MAVTIQMIETKEFKTKPRGYDPEEVDLFLDEIVDEFERMQSELKKLRAAAASPQARPAAPAPRSTGDEESVRMMLVNAQRICDETMNGAKQRADTIVQTANDQAEDIVRSSRAEVKSLEAEMSTLRSAVTDYRARFKRLVDDQMHLLNADPEL